MKSMFKGALSALMVILALSGLTAASAFAAGAPIVETKPATEIEEAQAKINGIVNPNGASTKYYFEYGPTTSYGTKTSEGTVLGTTTVIRTAKSLTSKTIYHFRLVATNSSGTSYGSDEQFTTLRAVELVLPKGKATEFEFSASGGSGYVEWSGGKALTCSSSSFTGHFINSTEVEGTMRWSECFGGDRYECLNEKTTEKGYFQSWIQSEELKGKLGYINRAKKEVGLRLSGKSSEVWAKNVNCLGSTKPLNGSLGGQLSLPVNTKILTTQSFGMVYIEKEDKQTTGELGGQLLYSGSSEPFGFSGSLTARANKEFEIQA